MDATETKRFTEALKRVGDNDRAFVLNWLILYYEDDGRMRSPRAPARRSIVMDGICYYLIRAARKLSSKNRR